MAYSNGDRVVINDSATQHLGLRGKTGTIKGEMHGLAAYHVEFDDNIGGHDCGGKCKRGFGRNMFDHEISKLELSMDEFARNAIEGTYGI